MTNSLRVAFVMEQALGHVTYGMNLRSHLETQRALAATWLPIGYELRPWEARVPYWRSHARTRANWWARRALLGALRRRPHQAAFIHTQAIAQFSGDVLRRLPSVISLDATPVDLEAMGAYYGRPPKGDGLVNRLSRAIASRAARSTFRSAAAMVSMSEWAKRSLVRHYGVEPQKVHVLHPGVAPPFFEIGRRRGRAGAGGGSASEPVRLLFVGGDFRRKGGDLLLDCMRGPLGRRCELDVVTPDSSVQPQPNVRVYSDIRPNSPELFARFTEADVFVLPSRAECYGHAAAEAMTSGLPVVVTDVGGLPEVVPDGEAGFVIPAGSTAALTAALETLVGDGALRQRMGHTASDRARQLLDARRNYAALTELLVSVAG